MEASQQPDHTHAPRPNEQALFARTLVRRRHERGPQLLLLTPQQRERVHASPVFRVDEKVPDEDIETPPPASIHTPTGGDRTPPPWLRSGPHPIPLPSIQPVRESTPPLHPAVARRLLSSRGSSPSLPQPPPWLHSEPHPIPALPERSQHRDTVSGAAGGPSRLSLPAIQPRRASSLAEEGPHSSAPLADPDIEQFVSIPTMVLKSISLQQGQQEPAMESEISGAASGAAIVGVGNIAGSVLKYGSNFLLQRSLGANLYGLYAIAYSLVWLVAPLFNLGLGDTMVRYMSTYHAKRQSSPLLGVIIFGTAVAGIAGMLGALFLLLFAPLLAGKRDPQTIQLLQLMATSSPLICLQLTWFGGLQALKAFKWRVLSERLLPPITLVALLLLPLLLLHHVSLVQAGLATLLSTLVGTLVSFYFLFRTVSRDIRPQQAKYEVRRWVSFAVLNTLTSLTETFLESIDVLLLAVLAVPGVQIGQYNASVKFTDFILMPLYSFNTMFAPTIVELHAKGERQKLGAMFQVVTKWTITLSLPIFLVAALFAKPLLALSGDSFIGGWPILVVSAVGSLAYASTGSVGYMLAMTGYQRVSLFNALMMVALNIVLGILLTPSFGALGTAISTGLSIIIANSVRLIEVAVLLKVQPYRWDTIKPLGAGAISGAVTLLLLSLLAHLHPLLQLGIVPITLTLYAGILILLKGSPEDQVVVNMLLKKLLRGKKGGKFLARPA